MPERDPNAPREPQTTRAQPFGPVRDIPVAGGAEPEPTQPGNAPIARPGRPRRIPRPFVPTLPPPRPAQPDEPDTPPTEHGFHTDRMGARRMAPLRGFRGVRGLAWLLTLGLAQASAAAAPADDVLIRAGGRDFTSWSAYLGSNEFRNLGLRCQTPARDPGFVEALGANDCSYGSSNPSEAYDPALSSFEIPVVFHVLQRSDGQGYVSPARIAQQIDVLNQDFGALANSPGAPGVDTGVRFQLATLSPTGAPTAGITYSTNDTWFQDAGNYWTKLAWDPERYLNVYTNNAGGALGYVPGLPQTGLAGSSQDRVVLLHSTVGNDAPIGAPYHRGRTATHEFGHYLGLFHTFDGGCGSASLCNSSGDTLCDTNRESGPHYGCSSSNSCGSADPIHNYMDYTDDTCMWEFSEEQARRMRCTVQTYRAQLPTVVENPWDDLGQGLPGLTTPHLTGSGTLAPGEVSSLSMTGGLPLGVAFLVLGLDQLELPFKGGTMVPSPDAVVPGVPLDAAGGFETSFFMPLAAPSGIETYWQVWVQDGFAPVGFASTNGLRGTIP